MKIALSKEEISQRGKFPPERRKVIIYSVGNDLEAHGPALPPEIDSIMARALALQFSLENGCYYAGHIPYTSDRVGEIARDWSPLYIPFEEFVQKTKDWLKWSLSKLPWKAERVIIFIGHGGLIPLLMMEEEFTRELESKVKFGFVASVGEVKIPENIPAKDVVEKILTGAGEHAYILEHSVALALGVLDEEKLKELNQQAEKNPEEVLRNYPALAGLAGFLLFGDKDRYQPLREAGLEFCLNDFLSRRKIEVSKELGEILIRSALDFAKLLLL